ncbi:hypothetical protein D3C71_1303590 [compost metagenome]
MRSNPVRMPADRRNRSAGFLTYSFSTSCSMILSPMPSTSNALRETKCFSASLRCAAQISPPVQRATASPSTLSTSEPHTGQCCGNTTSRASAGRRSVITPTTCGITSPARRTITVSPMRRPKRSISSALCSVALLTITPATSTGSRRATGVIAPVRPTWNSTSRTRVICSCAGNLNAVAQRGARATKPSVSCRSISSIFTTTPSISKPSCARSCST